LQDSERDETRGDYERSLLPHKSKTKKLTDVESHVDIDNGFSILASELYNYKDPSTNNPSYLLEGSPTSMQSIDNKSHNQQPE